MQSGGNGHPVSTYFSALILLLISVLKWLDVEFKIFEGTLNHMSWSGHVTRTRKRWNDMWFKATAINLAARCPYLNDVWHCHIHIWALLMDDASIAPRTSNETKNWMYDLTHTRLQRSSETFHWTGATPSVCCHPIDSISDSLLQTAARVPPYYLKPYMPQLRLCHTLQTWSILANVAVQKYNFKFSQLHEYSIETRVTRKLIKFL